MSETFVGEFFELVDPPAGPAAAQPVDDSLLDSSEASDQETGGEAEKSEVKEKVKGPPEPSEDMEVDDDGLMEPPVVQEEREPVRRTPNLAPFKSLFLDSLAELLEGFEQFALTEASIDKELIWSVGHRDRRFKQV